MHILKMTCVVAMLPLFLLLNAYSSNNGGHSILLSVSSGNDGDDYICIPRQQRTHFTHTQRGTTRSRVVHTHQGHWVRHPTYPTYVPPRRPKHQAGGRTHTHGVIVIPHHRGHLPGNPHIVHHQSPHVVHPVHPGRRHVRPRTPVYPCGKRGSYSRPGRSVSRHVHRGHRHHPPATQQGVIVIRPRPAPVAVYRRIPRPATRAGHTGYGYCNIGGRIYRIIGYTATGQPILRQ